MKKIIEVKICGNCHDSLRDEDQYCRYCGTKRGEGAFEPYENIMECIYGPMPINRSHKCNKCGYEWTNCVMVDSEKYCPKCGNYISGWGGLLRRMLKRIK